MNIIERGQKKPQHPWLGRYLCAHCKSVIELTEEDVPSVTNVYEDQCEGWSAEVICPVCEGIRSLLDCDHVIGRCRGRGRRDK